MSRNSRMRPSTPFLGGQLDEPVYVDDRADRIFQETSQSDDAVSDRDLANRVAAATETPEEAQIDSRMGLRGAPGRVPEPADFAGLLTPEGNSGDIVGSDVSDQAFELGEDGSTLIPH